MVDAGHAKATGWGAWRRMALRIIPALVVLYVVLLIPDAEPPAPPSGQKQPFAWNQDQLWSALEAQFAVARSAGCDRLRAQIDSSLSQLDSLLAKLAVDSVGPEDERLALLEARSFHPGPMIAACPERLREYIDLYSRMREVIKRQSQRWNLNSPAARNRLYRLLYGGRAAVEEIMLQAPPEKMPSLIPGNPEPSSTPAAEILGVTIHSGDLLVSRGGAPTSALIARGNDYPGNFSHVALVHVDEQTHRVSIIESHIEKGVAIASIDDYLKDTKLRVMALRLRADLPQLATDPFLPHRAAASALADARTRHIAYDFEMDYRDYAKMFCSEVASAAYAKFGVTLWMGLSNVSSRGARSWLGAFGVRHFETQEPADLEYDPQLRVIAEWRDPETLYKDHLDNAVIDIMLEGADSLETLGYAWYLLPVARVMKASSWVLNLFGAIGPVPEGMNATAALRNKDFSRRHDAIKARLVLKADEFKKQNGYTPPYWALVRLAREAKRGM